MKSIKIVVCFLAFLVSFFIFLLLAKAIFSGYRDYRDRIILDKRIADVRALTDAYTETTKAYSIDDLISVLKQRNIKLNNPIARDPSKPCYRLMVTNGTVLMDPQLPLIEETNVTDNRAIVISFCDGSIMARLLTNSCVLTN